VISLSSCAYLATKPALPRHAEIESAATPTSADELSEIVARADIFYLPTDRLRGGAMLGPGRRLLDALHRSGTPVTLGWGVLALDAQPLLDQWNTRDAAGEGPVDRLSFATQHGEYCRVLLRASHDLGVSSVALGCGAVPANYECVADNIARQFRSQGGGKLFIIMERRDIEAPQGVPYLVGQKIAVRQLVLDSKPPPAERSQMLTRRRPWRTRGSLEVVDSTPRSGSNGF